MDNYYKYYLISSVSPTGQARTVKGKGQSFESASHMLRHYENYLTKMHIASVTIQRVTYGDHARDIPSSTITINTTPDQHERLIAGCLKSHKTKARKYLSTLEN